MSRNIVDEELSLKRKMFDFSDIDDLFTKAAELVIQYGKASSSLIQRKLSIGYARAARIMDQLESAGVLKPGEGVKPREVLIKSIKDLITPNSVKEKEEIHEPVYKYSRLNIGVIKKPKENPWKKTLFDAVNNPSCKKAGDYSFPLGYEKDKVVQKDIKDFTHLSITGNTSSQKEILLDTILISLLIKLSPNELKLILIDETGYLSFYDGLPHLLSPVITDYQSSISALRWLHSEMDRRQKLFVEAKVRGIESYNKVSKSKMPEILTIFNHFDNGILYSPVEIEDSIIRLTSMAHKTGIHIVITTNRLTNKEVPMEIQSNFTNKVFFRLTNSSDTGKLKIKGIEKLGIGESVILSEFENEPIIIDAIYTSEENVKEVVQRIINPY